jgi:hypothetical protein
MFGRIANQRRYESRLLPWDVSHFPARLSPQEMEDYWEKWDLFFAYGMVLGAGLPAGL